MADENMVIEGYVSAAEIAAMKEAPKESPQQPVQQPDAGQKQQQPVEQKAETATPVTPAKPAEASPQAQQPAPVQQPVQATDFWKEVTPQSFVDRHKDKRADVLKAYGLNDFIVDAINYYERTGSLAEYAEVKSVDYSKMSDDEVLRKGLRQEVAHMELTPDDMQELYEIRITNRFKTDAEQFSEKEVKAGKLEMRLEADRLRRQFIENQKKFVAPEPVKQEPVQQPDPQQQMRDTQQFFSNVPEVKQLMSEKKLVLGAGERAYNYEVTNPQELFDIMTNSDVYNRQLVLKDDKGNPVADAQGNAVLNYKKLMKAAAFIKDDAEYDRLLINHGISLGLKGFVDSIEHPESAQQTGNGEPQTLWGAFKNAKIS